jgi:putative heme-binding domain-containing protein
VALPQWQDWFAKQYPTMPPAVLPVEPEGNKWSFAELVNFLGTPAGAAGDAARGSAVFEKAQCVKCHRYGARGEGVGPDLTTVSQRFQKREIVESVISPSQVISDQYASKTVVTDAGQTYTGILSDSGADAIVVLQASGEKVKVGRSEIVETSPSQKSAMPEGLFNALTLEEIADLFAYLSSPPAKTGVTAAGGPVTRKPRPK